jgi:hypothetical protein
MADIDIVPRRRTSTWMWILLALVVLVVLWAVMGRGDAPPSSGSLLPSGGGPAQTAALGQVTVLDVL